MDELTGLLPPGPAPRELPNHAAHRAGLLAAVAAEPATRDALWPPPRTGLNRSRWLVAAAAAAAVVAIAVALTVLRPGTAVPPGPGSGQQHPLPASSAGSLTATRHWQVPASGLSRLVVDSQAGFVGVSGGQAGRARLTAVPSYHGQPPTMTSTVRGSVLTVTVACPAGEAHCQVALTVEVPRRLAVDVTAGLGNVTVAALAGPVHVTDELGNVRLPNLTGAVSADARLGNVGGSGLGPGSVQVTAQLGSVSLAFAVPPALISATADEGSVTIRVPASTTYRVRYQADLGSTQVSVPQSAAAVHRIQASAQLGSVTVAPS
jgi:hypothetical protein